MASKLIVPPSVETKAERLELDDGDFLDIHWSLQGTGPVVCLFHGLAGCIDSAYARGAIRALQQRGYRTVFMHWRGCSGEPNRLARSYHSGATDDIHRMVELVSERYPEATILAAGFSLGANALLKYLGEQGTASRLAGAVAVCPPLVLSVGADKMNRGLARGYQRYLLKLMRAQIEAKRALYPALQLPLAGEELNSFWRFDDVLTAPVHGFADVHDYYTRASARQFLKRIATPTRILYARDDPFFTPAAVPKAAELGSSVILELSDHGGHVGFIGTDAGTRANGPATHESRWLDDWVARELVNLATRDQFVSNAY